MDFRYENSEKSEIKKLIKILRESSYQPSPKTVFNTVNFLTGRKSQIIHHGVGDPNAYYDDFHVATLIAKESEILYEFTNWLYESEETQGLANTIMQQLNLVSPKYNKEN